MTKEIEVNEINNAYDSFMEERKQDRIKEAKELVKGWQTIRKIQDKKEAAKKKHE